MQELDSLERSFQERHQYAMDWKARTGGKAVGIFCTYIPEEVLYAAGTLPVRVFGSHEIQDVTEPYIFSNWCPFCRDCLAQGLLGKYDYLEGLTYAHCCMHMRQAFTNWIRERPVPYSLELYIPSLLTGRHAKAAFTASIEGFRRSVEEWLGITITDADLDRAIEVYNTNRSLLGQLYELRQQDNPPLSGAEAMAAVLSSQVMDKAEHSQLLRRILQELPSRSPVSSNGDVRLMMIGSENDDLEFVRFVESLGAVLVADELCTGSSYFRGTISNSQNRAEAIAQRYIDRPPCPHKDTPDRRRLPHIRKQAKEYNVQGVLLIQQKFCQPHAWDFPAIRTVLDEESIPSLTLEFDITVPVGQFRTRIEAFLEIIQAGAI